MHRFAAQLLLLQAGMALALHSMTGFGRSAGITGAASWSWELRAVNARGLDLRLKLPPGWDAQEPALRQLAATLLQRGSVQAQLAVAADAAPASVMIRTDLLERLLALATGLAGRIDGAPPPRAEALLALPGVLRFGQEPEPVADAACIEAVLAGFAAALEALVEARRQEGARLGAVLGAQIDEIAGLAAQARLQAAAQQAAQRDRLRASLRALLDEAIGVSEERLAQELALLATRADVREELDRLDSHVAQARTLLQAGTGAGRRLDFLVQEFNREANTLCSKSATLALTTIGLRLKAVIEQVREQVQNIE